MNSRTILALSTITVVFVMLSTSEQADAAIFVKIPGIPGDSTITTPGYDDGKWFVADSFSFGVEREMKESGEKAGTADINIGIGELQEVTISKSMDQASMALAQHAINGNSCQTAEIDFVEVAGSGKEPVNYMKYKLDRCYIKSWSVSGDADDRPTEEVSFYYNKIAFAYAQTKDGKNFEADGMSWDVKAKSIWDEVENLIRALLSEPEPPTCEEQCHDEAGQIFNDCLATGQEPEACRTQADAALRICLAACFP